jgi:hypothetical protein
MAFNVSRSLGRVALPQPEILKWPLSHARLPSVVVRATGLVADAGGTPYEGRRYLLAGTVLVSRPDGQYEVYTGDAIGTRKLAVLFRTTEFADGTSKSDKPVAIIDEASNGTDFDKSKILGWGTAGIQSAVLTAFGAAVVSGSGATAVAKGRNNFE